MLQMELSPPSVDDSPRRNCTPAVSDGEHPEDAKKATFSLQNVKKGTPNLASLYVHILFTIFFIKQIFFKKAQHPEVGLSFNLK